MDNKLFKGKAFRGAVSSKDKPFGWSTIMHRETGTKYLTRFWIGRLRLHFFYRGDSDKDPHDHPWRFWTFPLMTYVEEVSEPIYDQSIRQYIQGAQDGPPIDVSNIRGTLVGWRKRQRLVHAWRWHYRPAKHTHIVLGKYVRPRHRVTFHANDQELLPFNPTGLVITLVWRGPIERPWGFLKNREGKWCWVHWADYVFGTGKSDPC